MKLNTGIKIKLKRAENALENSNYKIASKILKPLIVSKIPAAILLEGNYSKNGEPTSEFERRHYKSVEKAAKLGWPPAIYQLGVYFDTGDYGEYNPKHASELFKEAALQGHPRSQWIYATELLWGQGNFEQNIKEGLIWLEKSVEANFYEALETMARIYEKGEFGNKKDQDLAEEYRKKYEIAYEDYLDSD